MSQTNRFDFSTNWNNKLSCAAFTTLRLSGRFAVGDRGEVWLKDTFLGVVEVIDKKRFESPAVINEWVAQLDTGYSADETRNILARMYRDVQDWSRQPVYYYLLRYTSESAARARLAARKQEPATLFAS
ncbi:MAG: hypothetical protein ACK4Q5_06095 [Saprospiraceae bacterium]